VYLNYGMHWLLNVLLKGAEEGFVLIRAVEPTRGVELMEVRRRQTKRVALCSGPAKLCQAFSVTGADHGRDLCRDPEVGFRPSRAPVEIVEDVRIGISKAADLPWRFLLKDSAFVSVPLLGAAPRVRKRTGAPAPGGKRKSQSG
jgi:DNA-3-methyladenine glycosylase